MTLNWLRSHYYCGDEADPSRLNLLGNYVEGIAADWYAADVDNPDKMTMEPMRVEYLPSEGVEGFYYRLDKMASRMIERPSDYSFRLRLYEGLPAWIYDTLLERNILPKFCTLEDIWENARQIEELSLRARGNFRGSSATSLLKRPQNEPQRSHSSMKPRASASGGFKPFQPNNNIRSSGECPSDIRPNNVQTFNRPNPTTGRNNIQPSRGQGHSSGSLRQVKPGAPRADQGPRDNKLVECYRCHQIGHIATDTKCPQHPSKTGHPRFNAQRLIEDKAEGEKDVQEEHPEDHDNLQDVNSWGGSQYDPEDEGDRFEEEPAEDKGHEEEEDIEQDKVCMSSMRMVWMYTMWRIREEGEIEDLAIFSRIAEPPIPDIEDVVHHVEGSDFNAGSSTNNNNTAPDPTWEIEREEPPIDGSSNANDSIHSHLFDEDIPIADPVYIEYRDGLFSESNSMMTGRHSVKYSWRMPDVTSVINAGRQSDKSSSRDNTAETSISISSGRVTPQSNELGLKQT
ncbi:hypothetical protein PILCRDRAFT_13858 [Piloderma croceum F 1598]|uniref:CCHC-type domain-containing protein n=1 Tax=Piloderma croceum (strain F 1598) TaxID=765440 RepID=A0A0C3F589_PILCF|nr:hypothetical protein PILCRDRAFT_13858 [Piloderma croceum F 1598]